MLTLFGFSLLFPTHLALSRWRRSLLRFSILPFFSFILPLSRMRPISGTLYRPPSSVAIDQPVLYHATYAHTHTLSPVPHYGNTSVRFCQHQLPFKSASIEPECLGQDDYLWRAGGELGRKEEWRRVIDLLRSKDMLSICQGGVEQTNRLLSISFDLMLSVQRVSYILDATIDFLLSQAYNNKNTMLIIIAINMLI